MAHWKYLSIVAIILAVTVNAANVPYDPAFIEEINDIVLTQKSNTLVALVAQDEIKFVSTEGNAPKHLKEHRDEVRGMNLEIVRANFIPLNTTDVWQKLAEIGETRRTFLAYFTAQEDNVSDIITTANKKPVGLLGKLLGDLGINVTESGLLALILSLLGIGTTITEVTTMEFENAGSLDIPYSTISPTSA